MGSVDPDDMEGAGGYALCSWYKQMCRDQGRATGTVCAVTSEPDQAACEAFGLDRCMPKPVSTPTPKPVITPSVEWARTCLPGRQHRC